MKGYILYDKESYKLNFGFANMIMDYAKQKGIHLTVLLREDVSMSMENSKLKLVHKSRDDISGDFILNRCIDPMLAEFAEGAGFRLFNSFEVCRICNDKRLTHIYFANKGIPMVNSVFLNKFDKDYTHKSYPAILKAPDGHGGKEVFWLDSPKDFDHQYENRLVQAPVKKLGYDLRVYVMNGEILAPMLRHSSQDFRSNFTLGGTASLYTLSKEEKDLVNKVIKCMPKGALYVGIDFIFDEDTMFLNEIEDIVGSRMLYSQTSIPVHELLVDSVINEMNKGEPR